MSNIEFVTYTNGHETLLTDYLDQNRRYNVELDPLNTVATSLYKELGFQDRFIDMLKVL
jgi:predicted GNAT family acetyltransferase